MVVVVVVGEGGRGKWVMVGGGHGGMVGLFSRQEIAAIRNAKDGGGACGVGAML